MLGGVEGLWPVVFSTATPLAAQMQRFIIQLAVVLLAARLGGRVVERWLRLPAVVGEIFAGVLIGPYALGGIHLPGLGTLFPMSAAGFPVSPELYGLATLASLLLLFMAGLETDVDLLLRFSRAGSAVGIGGIVLSFASGVAVARMFGFAVRITDPVALFLGVIASATSIGIAARMLAQQRKTNSPEGVTILTGAVIDDVLGVVLLAVVVALARVTEAGGRVPWLQVGGLAARAIFLWIACTVIALFSARRFGRLLKGIGSIDVAASVALGLALLLAGLLESAGLAMILGAYLLGLSLSRTDLVHAIRTQLAGTQGVLVPVFFCVMGMLIDPAALSGVATAGLVFAFLAIVAKVIGGAVPAWFQGFNLRGMVRIGLGMAPRGEVALIAAGVGMAEGFVSAEVFGIAVGMTLASMIVVPPLLAWSLHGGPGLRRGVAVPDRLRTIEASFPSADLAEFLTGRLVRLFRNEEFFVYALSRIPPIYQIRKDEMIFTLTLEGATVRLTCPASFEHIARLMLLEEVVSLKGLVDAVGRLSDPAAMGGKLVDRLF